MREEILAILTETAACPCRQWLARAQDRTPEARRTLELQAERHRETQKIPARHVVRYVPAGFLKVA